MGTVRRQLKFNSTGKQSKQVKGYTRKANTSKANQARKNCGLKITVPVSNQLSGLEVLGNGVAVGADYPAEPAVLRAGDEITTFAQALTQLSKASSSLPTVGEVASNSPPSGVEAAVYCYPSAPPIARGAQLKDAPTFFPSLATSQSNPEASVSAPTAARLPRSAFPTPSISPATVISNLDADADADAVRAALDEINNGISNLTIN